MTDYAKFEAIRTQAIESEHTSLSSTDGAGYEIGVQPRPLSWWRAGKFMGAVMDLLAIALSCTFFVYALAVKMHERLPMESPRVKLLLKLSKLGPTIYPFLFAAIIGRSLKSIAFWKLERGSRIGTIDRLLGSTTIVQTVLTQVQMRSWSFLSLLLVAVWSLSPSGSQASLRIINSRIQSDNITRPIHYVNTSSDDLYWNYIELNPNSSFVPVNILFGAAIAGISSSGPVDAWNNMKIPRIENLDSSTIDLEGWFPVPPQLDSNDGYSSLIGLPLSWISHTSNLTTSFSIETSYWTLSCPIFEDLGDGTNSSGYYDHSSQARLVAGLKQFADPQGIASYNVSWPFPVLDPLYTDPYNFNLYTPDLIDYRDPWDPTNIFSPRHLTYLENNNNPAHWVGANCTIETTYVEVFALCSNDRCTAVKLRESRRANPPETWTLFESASCFQWFGPAFVNAFHTGQSKTATVYQKFVIDPQNPFNESYLIPPVTVVSNATFALRLSQLLNTYWMAMLAPNAIPMGLRNPNITADVADMAGTIVINTTATETQQTLVLECNSVWFTILLLSSAITVLIGTCGLIAAISRLGPDIGFNISSLVKDSPFVNQASVASTTSSTDRSRLMESWYAKLGDVAAGDEFGHIAIGSGNVADLQRGRLYR